MRVAVVQFPGSNADWDALHTVRDVLGFDGYYVFHKEESLKDADAVVIPGGFSYGDYLRPGAIAGFSPITKAIREFAADGKPILGICNGFQILTELGLLPGALTRNAHLRFECRDIHLRTEASGAFTNALAVGSPIRLPIAHADGRYQCDKATLESLVEHDQIAFRYCTSDGVVESASPTNPNGSLENIAGIYNQNRNILGMMPHPERASEHILGNADGYAIFQSLRNHLEGASQ